MKHSGEKLFLCRQCDFRCTRADSLKKHMLTHSGERPFVWKHCNYSFSATCDLKKHMLTHSGERPCICKQYNFSCKKNWSPQDAHAHTFRRKAFQLHTVQLYLHTSWCPQKTHSDQFGGKKPSAAHSVNSPAQGYLTSRNTCWSIQERSLSGVTSGTIHALGLLCLFYTLKNAHWEKSDKCNQCDFASSVACYLRTHLKNTQWRKVKQMSGEQMYYNHLRQAFYGDT